MIHINYRAFMIMVFIIAVTLYFISKTIFWVYIGLFLALIVYFIQKMKDIGKR